MRNLRSICICHSHTHTYTLVFKLNVQSQSVCVGIGCLSKKSFYLKTFFLSCNVLGLCCRLSCVALRSEGRGCKAHDTTQHNATSAATTTKLNCNNNQSQSLSAKFLYLYCICVWLCVRQETNSFQLLMRLNETQLLARRRESVHVCVCVRSHRGAMSMALALQDETSFT